MAYQIITGAADSTDANYNGLAVGDVTVTNEDDDDDPAQPSLSISDVTVTEGDTGTVNAVFKVRLSEASTQTVTVEFGTASGTAIEPADYLAQTGTVNFNPNEISKDLEIVINGDLIDEADETFTVTLSAPVNAVIAQGQGSATGTIVDDDGTQAPTGLTATGKAKKIELSWNEVENAASYRIQRSTSSTGGFALVGTVDAPTVTYTDADPSLVIGTTYYYRVTAVNGSGQESPSSNTASAAPKPRFEITAPTSGLTVSGNIVVEATANDESIGFSDVYLLLDGVSLSSTNLTPIGDGTYKMVFSIPTENFANGSHTIQLKDGITANSRNLTLIFDNKVSNMAYEQIFDVAQSTAYLPSSARIRGTVKAGLDWTIIIKDSDDNVVKSFDGTGTTIDVQWNGTNTSGAVVKDDFYSMVIRTSACPQEFLFNCCLVRVLLSKLAVYRTQHRR